MAVDIELAVIANCDRLRQQCFNQTPAGQYPLKITATSGSFTHSVTYNITVN